MRFVVDAGQVLEIKMRVHLCRTDVGMTQEFLHATQLVELCAGKPPVFINSPQGMRDANEKLFTMNFPVD